MRDYSTGELSYVQVADRLNALGFRQHDGSIFQGYTIRDIVGNRFYEGKVVYHQGMPDERVLEGSHEVPEEVKELWIRCQEVRRKRRVGSSGRPRHADRVYPFSRVLVCSRCGSRYHGEPVRSSDVIELRLVHERHSLGRACPTRPRTRAVASLCAEFNDRVLSQVHVDHGWKQLVLATLKVHKQPIDNRAEQERLSGALERLRKQHLWGDISDDEYRRERASLEQQLKAVAHDTTPEMPNLERAATLLNDLPALWSHPGVTAGQRESLVREVYSKVVCGRQRDYRCRAKARLRSAIRRRAGTELSWLS